MALLLQQLALVSMTLTTTTTEAGAGQPATERCDGNCGGRGNSCGEIQLLLVRHGQRYPLKKTQAFEAFFNDTEALTLEYGELTPHGFGQMRQLGQTYRGLEIDRAFYSANRRCQNSLVEFLAGAESPAQPETLGDVNYVNMRDLLQDREVCDEIVKAFAVHIGDRETFDRLVDDLEPVLAAASDARRLMRQLTGAALVDTMAVLDEMGLQPMNSTMRALDLDCAVAMSVGLRNTFSRQLGQAILQSVYRCDVTGPSSQDETSRVEADATESRTSTVHGGTTVAVVSDVHLLAVLEALAPSLIKQRPWFGSTLTLASTDSGVRLKFGDDTDIVPWKSFYDNIKAKFGLLA